MDDRTDTLARARELAGGPVIPAVRVARPASGPARWRETWSLRHTLATAGLTPLLWVLLYSAAGTPALASAPGATIALSALLGAGVLASYVPAKGAGRVSLGGACGLMPAVWTIAAPLLLSSVPSGLVLAVLAMAAGQRLLGASSCS